MKSSPVSIGLLVFVVIFSGVKGQQPTEECTGGKADITFVLDYSTSVGEEDFTQYLLPAVASIINGVGAIGPNAIRVAAVGFSTRPYLEFVFNDYLDKQRLLNAVKLLRYKDGMTATGDALFVVRKELVPRVRSEVKHLVIVLTDGISNMGLPVHNEGKSLRDTGAEVFAIGVGAFMNATELVKIASSDKHVLLIKDYEDLLRRAKEVTKLTCKRLTGMVDPSESSKGGCTGTKTELTFVLDASGSVGYEAFETHVKGAVRAIVQSLRIGPNADRVAMVMYSYEPALIFNLDTFRTADEILNAVKYLPYTAGGTATGEAIALVYHRVVPRVRVGVPHVVLIITDGNANIGRAVAPVSAALRSTGATIFSVGVGNAISRGSLLEMANKPDNVIMLRNYAELREKATSLASATCEKPKQTAIEVPATCIGKKPFFVTLLVDNSVNQGGDVLRGVLTQINYLLTAFSAIQIDIRFALVTYSDQVTVEFDYNSYGMNYQSMMAHVANLRLANTQDRRLGRAMNVIRRELAGKVRNGASHVVLLFIADQPNQADCYTEAAALLTESGIQLSIVTANQRMEKNTMTNLFNFASPIDESNRALLVFQEKTENVLRVNGILKAVCSLIPPATANSPKRQ
jgi:hypothetical protein